MATNPQKIIKLHLKNIVYSNVSNRSFTKMNYTLSCALVIWVFLICNFFWGYQGDEVDMLNLFNVFAYLSPLLFYIITQRKVEPTASLQPKTRDVVVRRISKVCAILFIVACFQFYLESAKIVLDFNNIQASLVANKNAGASKELRLGLSIQLLGCALLFMLQTKQDEMIGFKFFAYGLILVMGLISGTKSGMVFWFFFINIPTKMYRLIASLVIGTTLGMIVIQSGFGKGGFGISSLIESYNHYMAGSVYAYLSGRLPTPNLPYQIDIVTSSLRYLESKFSGQVFEVHLPFISLEMMETNTFTAIFGVDVIPIIGPFIYSGIQLYIYNKVSKNRGETFTTGIRCLLNYAFVLSFFNEVVLLSIINVLTIFLVAVANRLITMDLRRQSGRLHLM